MDLSTARWRKSTYSNSTATCVEVAFLGEWRQSSRSADTNTCVEVAFAGQAVGVRDSKNISGPVLVVPEEAFVALRSTLS